MCKHTFTHAHPCVYQYIYMYILIEPWFVVSNINVALCVCNCDNFPTFTSLITPVISFTAPSIDDLSPTSILLMPCSISVKQHANFSRIDSRHSLFHTTVSIVIGILSEFDTHGTAFIVSLVYNFKTMGARSDQNLICRTTANHIRLLFPPTQVTRLARFFIRFSN